MTSIELFNELNGKEVSRKFLQQILQQAKAENQTAVIYRVSKILNDNPDTQRFEVNIVQYPQGLAGTMHTGDYREALDDCGRLKKGWKFVKGNVVKVEKKQVTKSKGQGTSSKKQGTSSKKQGTKTKKNVPNVGKGYIPSENIPSVLSEEKANQPLPQTDSWRKKLKEASEKYHQEEQQRLEKEQEVLEKEKTLWKKISKKDKEEIKYLEGEIKSEEAFMSSLSRDRRAVEEWIKTGDLGIFNHYKIYGADAEAVRKQYERGGVESFRSQYGLAQKRIKKHTTQIEKIKQKYAEAEKPECKTCGKKYKFLIYKTQTSNKYTLAFSFADLASENKLVFDLRKTHKGKGYNEYFVINNAILLKKYKKGVDYLMLSKEDFDKKEFYKWLDNQEVGKGYMPSVPSEENNKTEAFLQKHKDIPLLEVILSNAQPLYEDSKTNRFGQTTDPEPNIIFWKKASKVRPESSEMIIKFKGITKHLLFSKETYREYVLFRFNKKAEAIFDQWQNILEKNKGLSAPQLELCTEDFKKMTVKELREFTLQYYLQNLKGKTSIIKKYLKEVVFTTQAGRKIAKGEAMYSAKAVAVTHLQELIENSTYNNWGDRKKTDSKDVLGYLNFKSKFIVDGEKKHLRISLVLYKDRKTELKNIEVGKKKKSVKSTQAPVADSETIGFNRPLQSKDTKKSSNHKTNDKNFGLGLPLTDEIRKKAFTDKGKLRKGWYYEENGLLTDGKEYYTSDNTLRYYGDKKNKIKTISSKKIEAIDKFISEKANKLSKEKQQFAEKLYEKIAEKFEITTKQTEYLCNGYMYSNHIHSRISLNYLEINDFRKHFGKTINRKFFTQYEKIKTRYADLYDYTFNDFSKQIIQYFIDELKKYDERINGLAAPTAQSSETITFNKEILKAKRGKLQQKKIFPLGKSRGVLGKFLGNKEMFIRGSVIKKSMKKDGNHILSLEDFINLPDYLNNPVAIFKSDTKEDALVILTEITNRKNKPVIVAISSNEIYETERVRSLYSKTRMKIYKTWIDKGLLLYAKKESLPEGFFKDSAIPSYEVGLSGNKSTEKFVFSKEKDKNFGLAAPVSVMQPAEPETKPSVFVEESPLTPEGETFEPVNELPAVAHHRKGSLAQQLANASEQTESYQIDRYDMAQFLGDMEIKNVDSLVITLTGGQGSGKTRFAFQFMNDLAQRYKVGHISIEEHPKSRLYKEKAYQYLNPTALNNIEAHDVRSLSEIDKIIRENDVIVIDSYQKIKEIDSKFEVDKDLRKKYNGKLFLVIFQQTSDGKMRGGSKSQFDGDIILFTEKFPNYQENYVYPDKNRYNSIPANQLKYNVFYKRLLPFIGQMQPVQVLQPVVYQPQMNVEPEEQNIENQVYDVIY